MPGPGFIFKYGTFAHPLNEVGFVAEAHSMRSSQDTEFAVEWHYNLVGQLLGTNFDPTTGNWTGALQTAAEAMIAAYSIDNPAAGCGLYLADGTTATMYTIAQANTVGGIQVLKKPQLEQFQGSSFGNFFPYSIQIAFKTNSPGGWGEIKDWVETITYKGTGGPRWACSTSQTGLPVPEQMAAFTPVFATQTGHAVGWSAYPTPPGPIWSSWEHTDQREIVPTGPMLLGPFGADGGVAVDYSIAWKYEFEAPVAADLTGGAPHVRYE